LKNSTEPALSVIIPVYNEAQIVASTVQTLTAYLDGKFPDGDYELIFADDGSIDATASLIAGLKKPLVRLVSHTPNKGKGAAVRDGMLAARGKYALFTDCDLAYGEKAIGYFYDELIKAEKQGTPYQAAIGSRRLSDNGYAGYTPIRKLASKTYFKVVALLAGFKYSDSQCGIKCFDTALARKVFSQCKIDGFAFDLEVMLLVAKSDARVLELPVTIVNHRASKVHIFRDTMRMLRDVMRIKRIHQM
jgi:Glycosyltransferases involved in cell wall biogenesis